MAAVEEIDVDLPHQSDPSICWATVTSAALRGMGVEAPPNELQVFWDVKGWPLELYEGQRKTHPVEDALKTYNCDPDIIEFDTYEDGIKSVVRDTLDKALNWNKIPAIFGLYESGGLLTWKDEAKRGEPYMLGHAILCVRYDPGAHTFKLKDPAQGNEYTHSELDLFENGFHYMNAEQFGPKARTRVNVPADGTSIRMVVRKIIVPRKPS
ncbi:MAG: hypothetical protein AAFN27_22855 [Pseudomonadota bacterium]